MARGSGAGGCSGGAPVTVRQMRNANTCHAQLLNFSATPHRLPNHCACTIVPRETPGLEPQLCYKWTGEQLFVVCPFSSFEPVYYCLSRPTTGVRRVLRRARGSLPGGVPSRCRPDVGGGQ
eukprot:404048-Prorocentrum_minimum.AAC.4